VDIKATRGVDWINNFWKVIANDLAPLKRMWGNVKQVMAPGALDPLTKELVYIAVPIIAPIASRPTPLLPAGRG
jgi:hypothetical protein